jgi:hypothetical protein
MHQQELQNIYTSLSASMSRRCCDISENVGRSSGFTFQHFLIISYLKGKHLIFGEKKTIEINCLANYTLGNIR